MSDDLIVKYRPTDFEELIGQDHIVQSLSSYKNPKDWPHTFLFTGPSGSGKTTTARIIATKLQCEPNNIYEYDAASHSSVEKARELAASLIYTGFGKTPNKLIIIDEAHSLTRQAIQVLLKPIEEPPNHVYFCLCTTEADKIPQTIKTRCQQYTLKPVSVDLLAEFLQIIAELEEFSNLNEKMFVEIARAANGSPRLALSLLSICRNATSLSEVRVLIQSAEEDKTVIDLCRLLMKEPRATWPQVLALINKLEETQPESVRLIVLAYMSKTLLGTKQEGKAIKVLSIMEEFSEPFNPTEKLAPLLLALGRCYFDSED